MSDQSESGAADAVGTTRPDSLGTSAAPPEVAARERRYDLRTPIIRAIYDVCQAIEECGASEKLTHAVTLAGALMEPVRVLLEERDALAAPVPDERDVDVIRDRLRKYSNPITEAAIEIKDANDTIAKLKAAAAPVPAREWTQVRDGLPPMFQPCIAYGIVKHLNVVRQMWEARRWTGMNGCDPKWEWLTPCDSLITDVTHWCSLDRPARV